MSSFASLGIPQDLLDALDAHGMVDAFAVQAATIPDALAGRDVCGRAPTGSGKTLAFGIPMVASVRRARPKRPRGLVLVPTRELAAQVARDLTWLGAARDTRVHAFYGGVKFETQLKALRRGVDIAVACPGRLADLVAQNQLRLDGVEFVVIDEADRMADMGFLPEVRRLLDQTSSNRQTLLFSATLDGDVDVLVRNYQRSPVSHDTTPPEEDRHNLTHLFWKVDHPKRTEMCAEIITQAGPTIVFVRTRHGADRLAKRLNRLGVSSEAIHGDRSQNQRERALRAFASRQAQALVATDVAARGIHIDDVACVVHHDLPADEKDYVHRSGRTGRANAQGIVVALVTEQQHREAKALIRKLSLDAEMTEPDLLLLGDAPVRAPRPVAPSTPDPTGRPSTGKRVRPRDRDRARQHNRTQGRGADRPRRDDPSSSDRRGRGDAPVRDDDRRRSGGDDGPSRSRKHQTRRGPTSSTGNGTARSRSSSGGPKRSGNAPGKNRASTSPRRRSR